MAVDLKDIDFERMLQVVWVPIDKCYPNEYNPNVQDEFTYQKTMISLQEFGWRDPIKVREPKDGKYEIVDGEHRWKAANDLGDEFLTEYDYKIPVINYGNVSVEVAQQLTLVLNGIHGEPDTIKLAEVMESLNERIGKTKLTEIMPYKPAYIDELLQSLKSKTGEVQEDDFDIEGALEEEPITKPGDLWLLGDHRLLAGDSTKKEDVERVMGGEKAVLMATDPPYGDSWVQKAKDMAEHGYGHSRAVLHGYIESDDLSATDLQKFLDKFLACVRIAGDPPFPLYVWHRAKRIIFEQALLDAGYLVHQPVIWVKPSFVIGRLHYHPRCEWALHGWLQGGGKCPFYGKRNQSDIWEIGRENDGLHPTQKPVELFAIPMRNHTVEDELCYEPFAGSGTQYIAAERLNRRVFGLEIEPRYCDVVVKRYINHVGTTEDVFVERDGKKLAWSEVSEELDESGR